MKKNSLLPAQVSVLGARMHPWTMTETVDEISRRMSVGEFTQHVVVNVAKIVNMRREPALREAVRSCDIINIDGMGVVWGARILGQQVPERVAGIDLFFHLLSFAEKHNEKVFFLGANERVVNRTVSVIQKDYPEIQIAGWHHGYFWDDEMAIVGKIAESGASMLFVAITSPKKEQFIHRWREHLGVKFAMGVGGTFDIIAGKTNRAPVWMQRYGLEWFYRVIQEPGRMWKRYLITNSMFLFMLMQEKMRRRGSS